jgi:predicted RNase H-like HicB family nuclease
MNTIQKGSVRCIVFKEEDTWYGVALEFNIVESGDDYDVVLYNLNEAIRGYVESLKKIGGAQSHALNQNADDEYERLWKNLQNDEPIPSPYQVRYFGIARV